MPPSSPISSGSSDPTLSIPGLETSAGVLAPGTLVGRYVILHLVGHGGAGLVYAAYDGELDRKLAIKFLRLRGDPLAVRELSHRLRREAQAMARLSHPNVVSIHDVGRAGEEMFLVMDLVPGGTLKTWLQTPRPWREVLALLCKAGDGLAAAHAAGVVHRDFKPGNVLVDGDQPRVTDFGIAAAEQVGQPSRPPPPGTEHAGERRAGHLPLEQTVETDGILGTVGYLAPEQALVAPADARSDQFSFCVTLFEALYGVLPFPSTNLVAYVEAISNKELRPPPAHARVPRAVHATILRGLSEDPAARFPSMEALLAELRHDRALATRRRVGAWAAIAALALSVALVARLRGGAPVCPVADEELGGAWTPSLRDHVGARLAAVAPFGTQTFAALAEGISRYARGVAQMRHEACEAARVRGAQSESVMSLRLQCLDGRARQLGTFVQILESADEKLAREAGESLSKLSPVAECADVASLTAPVPPPTREIATSVEAVRGELAELHALESTDRYSEAADRAAGLIARAESLGYAPLVAEARYALARAQEQGGHNDAAEKTLRDAIDAADEGKHDLLRGQAYVLLSKIVGRRLGHYDAAIVAANTALHVARRLGNESLQADALAQLGMNHGQTGHVEEGLRESTEALALKERVEGPDALDLASVHVALSVALSELGRFDDAQREDRRALAIVERAEGPSHPHAAVYRTNLSVDLVWAGRPEEAVPLADDAMRILRDAVGTEHPDYATAENEKGYALTRLGRFAEALPFNQDAAAISERTEGADASSVAYPLVGLGEDLLGVGQPDKALPVLERATRIAEANDLDPETLGECHFQLARAVWLVRHDAARATALALRAVTDYGRSPRLAPRAKAAQAFADTLGLERSAAK